MNSTNVAGVSFCLLFPIYVLYNLLIAYGLLPPFLGGYFGAFSALSMIAILVFMLIEFNARAVVNRRVYLYFVLCYLFSILAYGLAWYAFSDQIYLIESAKQAIVNFVLTFTLFLIGYNINLYSSRLYRFNFLFLFLFLFYISFIMLTTGDLMVNLKYLSVDDLEGSLSSYQGLARSLFVISIFLLSFTKDKRVFVIIAISSIYILFSLGARSELVGGVFGVAVVYFYKYGFRFKSLLVFSFVVSVLLICVFVFYDQLIDSRQFKVFSLSKDESWNSRIYLQSLGLQQISDNFIFGEFGGHAFRSGSVGGYMHNILSVWAGYGLLHFIIYIYLCVAPTLSFLFNRVKTDLMLFNIGLGFSCLLLIVFSKSMYWVVPGFLWGIYLNKNYKAMVE